jgi:predicted ribosome quality control (RQC) complex YloA/Tae2 family protein
MSLDGGFLHIVKTEILNKIPLGARIDKIHQPSRDEVVLTFRVNGSYERLLFSANAASARVCLTDNAPENPEIPPMFCVMLRKHIGNGRLNGITQDGLERILNFDFSAVTELGDTVGNRLIIEVMGRTSNIILVNADTGNVVDGIKRVTDEISSVRRILPNVKYVPPPRDMNRYCLLNCGVDGIPVTFNEKTLLKTLEGVSPIFVREALWYADENESRLREFLQKAKTVLNSGENGVTLVSDSDGKPRDFCFMPVTQYGGSMLVSRVESANALLDKFFSEKSGIERLKQRSGNIMKSLNTACERLRRKIESQKLELAECRDRDKFKMYGDLINANIYRLSKGDVVLEAENYISGATERIELDPRYTPARNAQKYYSVYRKLSNAEKALTKLIREGERELVYLDSVVDSASRAATNAEIDAIREEMGKKPNNPKGAKRQPKPLTPLKFESADGTEILVGRNNRQNDELTFKLAKADDIWLHTKDIAGSHVILRCSGGTPANETIAEAAIIAAEHSKARESSRVPVDYTFVKFVKKPKGAKPGYVIFTDNKTLYINPRKDNL